MTQFTIEELMVLGQILANATVQGKDCKYICALMEKIEKSIRVQGSPAVEIEKAS